ncbi:MAG: prolyl oligopeptidase family serine peptidase [Thermoproteota archaeon]
MQNDKFHPAAAKGFITNWLVCGPFPKIGPDPSGRNGFYIDFLEEAGGEGRIKPYAGLSHSSDCVKSGSVRWEEYIAEPSGFVDFVKLFGEPFVEFWNLRGGIAYAYTTIESKEHKRVVFLLGSEDSVMVWLNGKLVHHNNIGRHASPGQDIFVADLEAGINRLLVKVARYAGGWGFYLQRYDAVGKLFINEARAIIPHLRVGEKLNGWACLPIANTTKQKLNKIRLRVLENDIFKPSLTEVPGLAPGEWRSIPFWIAAKREARLDEDPELKISVEVEGEVKNVSLKPVIRNRNEWFMTTYLSKVDGSVQPYGLLIPTSYEGNRSYPLIVLLHGYKGGWAIGNYALKEWCIVAGVYARGEVPYMEIGERDVFEVIEAVKERYNIDEDRIYLTGHSMGGRGTWYLGLHRPDVWAAIAPLSARSYYHKQEQAGVEIPQYLWVLLDEKSPMYLAENALNLPIFVSHGSEDKVVPVDHSRCIVAQLREMGYTVEYEEEAGMGHTWSRSGRPWWGEEWLDRPAIFNFFHKYRRKRYPRKIRYKTNGLRFNKAYWVEIDEMNTIYNTARINAEVLDGNVIQVLTENVLQFTLELQEDLGIDIDKSLTIVVNGFKVLIESIPKSKKVTLREMLNEKGEVMGYTFLLNREEVEKKGAFPVWARLDEGGVVEVLHLRRDGGLKKRPSLFGPILDAFNSPFILVYGTLGNEAEVEANRKAAYDVAMWWKSHANGDCEVKADWELTTKDILEFNVILFGNPRTNILLAQVNEKLPIRFDGEGIRLGSQMLTEEDVGFIMIYPNPLNPERYMLLNSSITAKGMENIKKLYNRWMELPDYIIFNSAFTKEGWKGILAAGFFDKEWGFTA